jgi:hypothetical protein
VCLKIPCLSAGTLFESGERVERANKGTETESARLRLPIPTLARLQPLLGLNCEKEADTTSSTCMLVDSIQYVQFHAVHEVVADLRPTAAIILTLPLFGEMHTSFVSHFHPSANGRDSASCAHPLNRSHVFRQLSYAYNLAPRMTAD